MNRTQKYGEALDQLELLHRAGKISDAKYELHKQQMLAEATRPQKSWAVRFLIAFAVVAAVVIIIRVLVVLTGT